MFETTEKVKITKEQIGSWKILIAIPCYDQQVSETTMMSLLDTAVFYAQAGIKFSVSTLTDSLISRARNTLVSKFMALGDYTHLMFIDADIGFKRDAIVKVLWHDKDIITGSYPIKEIDWTKVADLAKQDVQPNELLQQSVRFVVNPVTSGQKEIKVDKGALSVVDAGTGFMLIKREALEKLFTAYPHLKYTDDTGVLNAAEMDNTYALFNSFVSDGRFLSEDYGFCRYWQDIGGEIWTDPTIPLTHLGRIKFSGLMAQYMRTILAE